MSDTQCERLCIDFCNKYEEAQAEIRRQQAEIELLRSASKAVISNMVGRLPMQGWLRDTDKSRLALDNLIKALKHE